MGAVNYRTSDYITLAAPDYSDLEPEEAQDSQECDRENAEYILKRYGFYYFHVSIIPGYYDGFSIDIENNFPVAFDFWQEKREAQKEITRIRSCLEELAGVGLVKCSPGWCTSYGDYKSTLAAIREAVSIMREEVKATPTWAQYMRDCGEV